MAGDSLARGAKSATFGPAAKISQAKWDAIWADEDAAVREAESQSGKDERVSEPKK